MLQVLGSFSSTIHAKTSAMITAIMVYTAIMDSAVIAITASDDGDSHASSSTSTTTAISYCYYSGYLKVRYYSRLLI
jgi:hypothetical protein